MSALYDWCKNAVASAPGTGNIVLASTVLPGYLPVSYLYGNNEIVFYNAVDGNNREQGLAKFNLSTNTLTNRVVKLSWNHSTGAWGTTTLTLSANTIISVNNNSFIKSPLIQESINVLSGVATVTATANNAYNSSALSTLTGQSILTASMTPMLSGGFLYAEAQVVGISQASQDVIAWIKFVKNSDSSTYYEGGASVARFSADGIGSLHCKTACSILEDFPFAITANLMVLCNGASASTFKVNSLATSGVRAFGASEVSTYLNVKEVAYK